MIVSLAKIECQNIFDWPSFHSEFMRVFGFPDFYGKNMDAWIDCMSSLNAPEDRMTSIHCEEGKQITIELDGGSSLKERCPEIFNSINECCAFVNWRLIQSNGFPVLALAYD